ncbi:MAG: DUF2207 domain-containing protein [Actinobacteria bacterium]|nr:DUF2207 domain-containing protein [Actinomycetota bacterium]
MRRLLAPVLLLALAFLAVPSAAHADNSDFTFDSFHADYTLTRLDDGTSHLEVVETLVAVFPDFDQNKGIIRAIPDDYDGVDLRTDVSSVVDENGDPVAFEVYSDGDFLDVSLGTDEYVHGTTTYVITYSQENVVRSFADTDSDEFYWDLNGTGWDQPFGTVSGVLHVDPALEPALSGNTACYSGPQGTTDTCPVATEGAATFSVSVDGLAPRENVTLVVGFDKGTFVAPVPTRGVALPVPWYVNLLSGGLGVLGLGTLGAAIAARVRSARGAASGRGTIIPQYSEPEGITILQAAYLESRPLTALPAALVRLAVRKNIRILAYAVEGTDEPYSLQYLGSQGANPEDLAILAILFGDNPEAGVTTPFGESQQAEGRELLALATKAGDSLDSAGFKERPPGRGLGALLVVVQVVLGIVALGTFIVSAGAFNNVSAFLWPTMLVGTVAFIVTAVLARRPLRLTAKGAEADEFLKGMKLYLTVAEEDRLRFLQSPSGAERIDVGNNQEMIKLYEKLLPWAVLWGVEDQWSKELELRVQADPSAEPDWFVGQSAFNAGVFSSAIGGFQSTVFAPASSGSSWSSSGSGFGSTFSGGSMGGGFSGGGGGGGGGGGR